MTVIEQYFEALRSGDMDQVYPLVTDTAEFVAVRETPDPRVPVYGTYRGHAGLNAFLSALRTSFETERFVVDEAIQQGHTGFACGSFRHVVRETGRVFESTWAMRAKLREGKIDHYLFFEDTARLEAAFGVSTAEAI